MSHDEKAKKRTEKKSKNRYLASHNFFTTFRLKASRKVRKFLSLSFDWIFAARKIRLNVALGAEARKSQREKLFSAPFSAFDGDFLAFGVVLKLIRPETKLTQSDAECFRAFLLPVVSRQPTS